MSYKLTGYNSVIRLNDQAVIPFDERNTDYQVYLEWVADGGIPEEAEPISYG